MFVDEVEHWSAAVPVPPGRFLILTQEDLDRVYGSRALSVLIDTEKGVDIEPERLHDPALRRERERLLQSFSTEELERVQKTLAETTPIVRAIVADARMNGVISLQDATRTVEQIMAAARDNAAALIAMSRLKDRDQTTYLHSLAVSALMTCFSRHLGFDEATVRGFSLGGLLHDIGKAALPISLLAKAGTLTKVEYAMVCTHPRLGHEMLRKIDGVPTMVLDICLHHHEHFDGRGYPDRLAGEEIPLAARIAAICDVYDAMTTVRPYKRAWTRPETISMMRRSKGHFDPELLHAFFSQLD